MGQWVRKSLLAGLLGFAVLAFAVWFLRPQPVLVDFGQVHIGTLKITVEEEARTRARDIYTVSAPVAGRVVRNPRIAGDPVTMNETTVAILRPTMPAFLDERSRSELHASLTAAEAAIRLTQHEVRRLEAERELAGNKLTRAHALADRGILPIEKLEEADRAAEVSKHALAAARAELEVQRNRHAAIQAQLADPRDFDQKSNEFQELRLTSPVSGEVLRVLQQSEAVVAAGTPLIEVADTSDLEIRADLLSTDAVQVEIGASARIIGWGGPPLGARVTRLDSAGFEKVSALGIEELRVPVILELTSPEQQWRRLKHNFRVTAEITLKRMENALLAPSAALFRSGDGWTVFVSEQGRARLRNVDIGLGNEAFTEVILGLDDGERVVLYPDERIADGTRVRERVQR
ncbi:HlyD family efflux transporter periplasmic adaptor subunit [Breoghania sp. L-A4]|uniref:efflux RND transporter periplasmic adaptor subunit n=1 Tax=Breoghania sp. L-A4 TaxID=2304600 RepID=UPI000E359598|nr:HlyD family efflux transporter periplasmic adaptor subunit [Breoghania sp. L-A4]AXS40197.1 HlyD family efflux transporter periplasmic adaptor subunit [Breoghania sp. L-A4]